MARGWERVEGGGEGVGAGVDVAGVGVAPNAGVWIPPRSSTQPVNDLIDFSYWPIVDSGIGHPGHATMSRLTVDRSVNPR